MVEGGAGEGGGGILTTKIAFAQCLKIVIYLDSLNISIITTYKDLVAKLEYIKQK